MTDRTSPPTCAVCDEASHAVCASGRCFCNKHSTCDKCHLKLANGELQWALISLGSSSPDVAQKNLHAVKEGNRALGATLVAKAVEKIREGTALVHGPGDECHSVAVHRGPLPRRIGASHDRERDASEVLSAAVN